MRPGCPGGCSAQLDLGIGKFAAMCLHLLLLGLCFGTLALAVGAAGGRRSLVFAVTATIGTATYVANSFLVQIDARRRAASTGGEFSGSVLRSGRKAEDPPPYREGRVTREPEATSPARPRRMRADALRNRERLLDAARDAVIEHGPNAPLDDIARRAGVGIGTLYRRFPDRHSLLRQVALDLLARSAHEGDSALASEPDAFAALARYMHRALDLRIAAAMPALAGQLPMDEDAELFAARQASVEPMGMMVARAQADGTLRPDVVTGDIGLLLVRMTRPLPGPFPPEVHHRLAHRHLDLVLAGLRSANPAGERLPGPAMTFDDLRAMPRQPQPDQEEEPHDHH